MNKSRTSIESINIEQLAYWQQLMQTFGNTAFCIGVLLQIRLIFANVIRFSRLRL